MLDWTLQVDSPCGARPSCDNLQLSALIHREEANRDEAGCDEQAWRGSQNERLAVLK
jgi:hypothetical protein